MKKKQNTRRNIAECIHKIYGYGMFVTAGFIVGFGSPLLLGVRLFGDQRPDWSAARRCRGTRGRP